MEKAIENMTRWDIAKLLEDAAKAIKATPYGMMIEINSVSDGALAELVKTTMKMLDVVKGIESQIDIKRDELVKSADSYYNEYRRCIEAISGKLKSMPPLPQLDHGLYEIKELIDTAERCDRLTDSQWARVIELAKAMAVKS